MADLADITSERAERETPYLLAANVRRVPPPSDGHCLNCGADIQATHRFCDSDCQYDWERQQEINRINGA